MVILPSDIASTIVYTTGKNRLRMNYAVCLLLLVVELAGEGCARRPSVVEFHHLAKSAHSGILPKLLNQSSDFRFLTNVLFVCNFYFFVTLF